MMYESGARRLSPAPCKAEAALSLPSKAGLDSGAPTRGSPNMTMIFDMIVFLVIGVAAGAIASFYMGRQQELLPNLVIGIVGAFIGGFIAKLLGLTAYNVIGEVVVATAGAILGLFIWQRVRGT